MIESRRRSATCAVHGPNRGLKAPATSTTSLRDWAALDFSEEREIAQLRRLWESIELEIIRVLEASNALKESPDYELQRLTTQTPAFFDETVKRHVAGLKEELGRLENDAVELA